MGTLTGTATALDTQRPIEATLAPRHFGWRYLHVIAPDAMANVVLHDTDIFGFGTPYTSVCHDALGAPLHVREARPGRPTAAHLFRDGTKSVERTATGFAVQAVAAGLALDGLVHTEPLGPGGILRTTLLELAGKKSYWEVQCAHARFAGKASSDHAASRLSGAFYMDRQWGDLPLQSVVSDWVWGHLTGATFELIFFHILTQQGASSIRTLHWAGDRWRKGKSLHTSCLQQLRQGSLAQARTTCRVSDGAAFDTRWQVGPQQLVRVREEERSPGFTTSYARWRVTASDPSEPSTPIFGVTECMRIRPL